MTNYNFYLSDQAKVIIQKQLNKSNNIFSYLRVGVQSSGCIGFKYFINYQQENIKETDLIFSFENIKVVIDHKSIQYLNGSTLDYKSNSLIEKKFFIDNPLEDKQCGCGESFTIKDIK